MWFILQIRTRRRDGGGGGRIRLLFSPSTGYQGSRDSPPRRDVSLERQRSFSLFHLSKTRNQSHVRQPRASWLLVPLCPRPSFLPLCLSAALAAHSSAVLSSSTRARRTLASSFAPLLTPSPAPHGPPPTLPRLYRFFSFASAGSLLFTAVRKERRFPLAGKRAETRRQRSRDARLRFYREWSDDTSRLCHPNPHAYFIYNLFNHCKMQRPAFNA